MSIRINWVNPNPNFDKIHIYRSTTKIDINALPTALATITTGTTYLDTTSVANTLYWYAVGVEYDGDIIVSVLEPAIQLLDFGPGPKELLCGDMNRGYFGSLTADEFVSYATLASFYGLAVTPTVPLGNQLWLKFAYGGKILFMPQGRVCDSVSYGALYSGGLVFGVDGPGIKPSGQVDTNQRKVYSVGDSDFLVRCARGGINPLYGYVTNADSEINSCIHALIQHDQVSPARQIGFAGYPVTAFSWASNTQVYSQSWLMENNGTTAAFIASIHNTLASTASTSMNTPLGWRPVLELIQPIGA